MPKSDKEPPFSWKDVPLKKRAAVAKGALKMCSTYDDANEIIQDMYKGETAVCIATGSSILDFTPEELAVEIGHMPVFALKMAAKRHEDIVDVCVSNFYNTFDEDVSYLFLARQEALHTDANKVNGSLVISGTHKLMFDNFPDLLWGSDTRGLHSRSVCNANRWEENSIKNSPCDRILGPGCLNDMAIPVMVHMGISHIKFMGWDGSDVKTDGTINHFYDVEKEFEPSMNSISSSFDLRNLKADLSIDEQEIVRNASLDIRDYLSKSGIGISIATKNSSVDEGIERDYSFYQKKL